MSEGLPLIPRPIARIIERWADKRLAKPEHKTTLIRQRIYILPTRHGIIFCIMLLLILTGSINYENSAGYLLTFLLTGIGFLGMIHTHQNLNHLTLDAIAAKPVYAGQCAKFPVRISRENNKEHFNVVLQSRLSEKTSFNLFKNESESITDIPLTSKTRGMLQLGKIKVFTEFPLGLFHAWSWVEIDSRCLIYPAPESHLQPLKLSGENAGNKKVEVNGNDDFTSIRDYQKGDSPGQLAWKAIARSGKLQSKLFTGEAGNEIWLRWDDLAYHINTEQRLSILCHWILECDHKGLNYGLDIPGKIIQPASGLHHKNDTLKALALFSPVKHEQPYKNT
ncbi:MAG: DUF58 domain-containing protein [Gammaproteobacteria bacterium]|nr:DUF58 domain-containing protein [Gammaproteobacteria bacterium]MDH5735264.1 DUF58 domain-containing protein [Gammaproteobacteria bacterium]